MWTIAQIVAATGGRVQGRVEAVASVVIDSRQAGKGALFVALKGERHDGHDFAGFALAGGAAAVMVTHAPHNVPVDAPLIIVEDTYKALEDMARFARVRSKAKIIAVTGSVGKTGTKEAIRAILSANSTVYATKGNLNNHIGLPLSLANLPPECDYGVFEMGMNHAGEISQLTRTAQPDIAVITNVEAVHLEFFDSVEAIADAKAEIMEGLRPGGTLILNRDNFFYNHLKARAEAFLLKSILTFGEDEQADLRLLQYRLAGFTSEIKAEIAGKPVQYTMKTTGKHWALTSLAALAVAVATRVDIESSIAALADFQEPDGRGGLKTLNVAGKTITLIDDCYNASPVSVSGAIGKLAELKKENGRTVAVLGDMLELGPGAAQLHAGLADVLKQHKITLLYAAGEMMKHLHDALPACMQGGYAENSSLLTEILLPQLQEGDIVLVKGSHGSRMDVVQDAIMKGSANAV